MNADALKMILDAHAVWCCGEGGARADMRWADLHRVNLRGVNLIGANLIGANLSGVNLVGADLSGANLVGADLRGANLTDACLHCTCLADANLTGACLYRTDLRGTDLTGAALTGTCLNPASHTVLRWIAKVNRQRGQIVYRVDRSVYVGNTQYVPGRTYVAPYLSFSVETACHPGIYAATLEWMRREHPNARLVRCYVRAGDWVPTAKGAIRCKRLRVLNYVGD